MNHSIYVRKIDFFETLLYNGNNYQEIKKFILNNKASELFKNIDIIKNREGHLLVVKELLDISHKDYYEVLPGEYIARNYFGNTYKMTKKDLEEKCILINSNNENEKIEFTNEENEDDEENKKLYGKDIGDIDDYVYGNIR